MLLTLDKATKDPTAPITSGHPQTNNSNTQICITRKNHLLPAAIESCCCGGKSQSKPSIYGCYICTRVLKLSSVLDNFCQAFDTPTAAVADFRTTLLSKAQIRKHEYQYKSPLERFLLEPCDRISLIHTAGSDQAGL